ncbi:MAG: class II aldolase/adducin family protein [Bdellovibrionia bacterium]
MSNLQLSQQILEVAKRLYARNMLAAADGNISYRISDTEILITPSGISKAFMEPEDMAVITLDNQILKGTPSSERLMHLEVYKKCPHAKCVVHAHPPTAIAWSVARPDLKELPAHSLSEVILATGSIPFVPYARPGQIDMGTVLTPYLPDYRAFILSRHGALTWGESLDEAWRGMERIEHSAQILKTAVELGGLTVLPDEELKALYEMRKKIGPQLL